MKAAALLLIAPALVAQAPKLSFSGFQTWMKATTVPGYKLMQCEQDGPDYTAAFMGATPAKVLMVRCGSLKSFDDVKRMPGAIKNLKEATLQGLRTRSYAMAGMAMLQIELKAKGCSLSLAAGEGMAASELDKLATALKVGEKAK